MEGVSFLLIGLVLGSRGLGLFPVDLVAAVVVNQLLGPTLWQRAILMAREERRAG